MTPVYDLWIKIGDRWYVGSDSECVCFILVEYSDQIRIGEKTVFFDCMDDSKIITTIYILIIRTRVRVLRNILFLLS